jgi:hypothetical protein
LLPVACRTSGSAGAGVPDPGPTGAPHDRGTVPAATATDPHSHGRRDVLIP